MQASKIRSCRRTMSRVKTLVLFYSSLGTNDDTPAPQAYYGRRQYLFTPCGFCRAAALTQNKDVVRPGEKGLVSIVFMHPTNLVTLVLGIIAVNWVMEESYQLDGGRLSRWKGGSLPWCQHTSPHNLLEAVRAVDTPDRKRTMACAVDEPFHRKSFPRSLTFS